MAKPPWADLVPKSAQGDYAEEVVSDVGEHVRTRPAPGFTPPGAGRPTRPSVDTAGVPYHQKPHDEEFGIRETEDLYAPPPPERPADGKAPTQPQEFEAIWMDRYLERTAGVAKPEPRKSPIILPPGYEQAVAGNLTESQVLSRQLELVQEALRKAKEKEEEAAKAAQPGVGSSLLISVDLPSGKPAARLVTVHCLQPYDASHEPIDVLAALAMIKALLK